MPEGRYKIVGILGRGGMGTVYAAEDQRLPGKKWAVKEIRLSDFGQDGIVREASALIQLSHPNLPHIADYFASDDGRFGYLVMEQVEGVTLEEYFTNKGRKLAWKEVMAFALQLCDVLAFLHGIRPEPMIHRDLKPANILVDANHRLVLIDFGTARRFKNGAARDTMQLGTVGFAAPEQLAGEQTDPRTDLYALGAIMFYLLSGGSLPLTEHSELETCSDMPDKLAGIVGKLLHPKREDRYATAEAVREALCDAQAELEMRIRESKHRPLVPSTPRKRLIVLLSLYPGAGSTTIGLTMAAILRQNRLLHTYWEHPAASSFLANWLRVDPAEDRRTNWLLQASEEQQTVWNAQSQLRMLYEQDTPILIADASHGWEAETIEELMQLADEIVVAAGPRLLPLFQETIRSRMERLLWWCEQGRRVTWVWNGLPNRMKPPERGGELPCRKMIALPYDEGLLRFERSGDPDYPFRDAQVGVWRGQLERWLAALLQDWDYAVGRSSGIKWFAGMRKKKLTLNGE